MAWIKSVLISVVSACIAVWLTLTYIDKRLYEDNIGKESTITTQGQFANQSVFNNQSLPIEDFTYASESSTASVVFIKNMSIYQYRTGQWMDWFFEPNTTQRMSTGSGVILSPDGYIVTNNHVIDGADAIEVVHGKRTYSASLIGLDPSTDLAVIKIDATDLQSIRIGNSSNVKVGELVLAVGNPFNLTSTVTAGIVSAKGRNINILRDKFPIESFIQTDAAINPGNSGGALVNREGFLIGINTAILSETGSYAGYGFAIPSDIVYKVFNDIVKHGEVQKAYLGAEYQDMDSEIADNLNIESLQGVIVTHAQDGWSADLAGFQKGDVIIEVNGTVLNGKSELEEMVGYRYPGDVLLFKIKRSDNIMDMSVVLMNREGTSDIIKRSIYESESLGVKLENISKLDKNVIGIKTGIRVVDPGKGFFRKLDIPKGFIITEINQIPIQTPQDLENVLLKASGKVFISGITLDGRKVYYPFIF